MRVITRNNVRWRNADGTVIYGPAGPLRYGTRQNLGTPADNDYLTRYPSVAAAISTGQYGLTSAYDHYMSAGKDAGFTYNFDLNNVAVLKASDGLPFLAIAPARDSSGNNVADLIVVTILGAVNPDFSVGKTVTVESGSKSFVGNITYIASWDTGYNLYVLVSGAGIVGNYSGGLIYSGDKTTKTTSVLTSTAEDYFPDSPDKSTISDVNETVQVIVPPEQKLIEEKPPVAVEPVTTPVVTYVDPLIEQTANISSVKDPSELVLPEYGSVEATALMNTSSAETPEAAAVITQMEILRQVIPEAFEDSGAIKTGQSLDDAFANAKAESIEIIKEAQPDVTDSDIESLFQGNVVELKQSADIISITPDIPVEVVQQAVSSSNQAITDAVVRQSNIAAAGNASAVVDAANSIINDSPAVSNAISPVAVLDEVVAIAPEYKAVVDDVKTDNVSATPAASVVQPAVTSKIADTIKAVLPVSDDKLAVISNDKSFLYVAGAVVVFGILALFSNRD